jgi:hypothetical protein
VGPVTTQATYVRASCIHLSIEKHTSYTDCMGETYKAFPKQLHIDFL